MNRIKRVANSTKKFVIDHKVAIAVVVTTLVAVKFNHMALREHNDFLKEHDLYEEFYAFTPE